MNNEFLREKGQSAVETDDRYKEFIKYIDFEIFEFDSKKWLYLFDRKKEKIIKIS